MTYSGKVVLVSVSGYVPERDDEFLRNLLAARIELFCAVGVDAEAWEDALDWICIGEHGLSEYVIITTSHKNESVVDVIEFAEHFQTREQHVLQVVHR